MNQHELEQLRAIVTRNLPNAHDISTMDIQSLPGGGNNRLFKVNMPDGDVVIKRYFRHPGDLRNRLDNEYRFSEFLWQRGVRCIPEPLARDDGYGAGLYRYVGGAAINPAHVTDRHVQEAESFLCQVNRLRLDAGALILPDAAEACFTIQQHIDVVERRIQRLLGLQGADGIHGEVADFVRQQLLPSWDSIHAACLKQVDETGQKADYPVDTADRILSPSDFGFHNALQTAHGLVFHDFEYAGWDDPAKTVCDFFCQIAVPVPMRYWDEVSGRCAQLASSPEQALHRTNVLLPVCRIKWVCIALNHFLAVDGERRRFARGNEEMYFTEQLDLAARLLSAIHFQEK